MVSRRGNHVDRSFVETCVRKRYVYRGRVVSFRSDRIRLPNGALAEREFMDHPGAVGVVPLLPGGRVVLVRQYRYPVLETTYELPAGKLDAGEAPLACVRRELREETGYTARSVRPLIDYWPTAAFANELLHLYVARGLKAGAMSPDDDEFVACEVVPVERALRWILSGRIRDSKTVIGLLACRVRGIV
ncbi:MAG: NUDIX hydrolase [Elusimicrobia bacterium]|nr:NUDIX hydrolase [Elusimicrobiota bacterium]